MSNAKSWTLLGHFQPKAKSSVFGLALSVIVAAETFGGHEQRYKVWMCFVILIASIYIAKQAISSLSIVGVLTALFSLVWIAPIIDSMIFYSVDAWFMITHSIFSLAVAVGAFSYLKN